MRILSFIFAFYIGFLTSMPAFCASMNCNIEPVEAGEDESSCCKKDATCEEESSCSNESGDQNTSEKKNCCEAICNPFATCSCCMCQPIERNAYEMSWIFIGKNQLPDPADLSSSYTSDCFQPPEIG